MDSFTRSVPLGFQQITDVSAAVGLTVPTTNPKPTFAVIVPAVQAVRFRDDGTNPGAAVGIPIAVGQEFIYSGDLSAIRFIEQVAGAELNVSFYKNAG